MHMASFVWDESKFGENFRPYPLKVFFLIKPIHILYIREFETSMYPFVSLFKLQYTENIPENVCV